MSKEDLIEHRATGSEYDPIIPQIKQWPIYKFYHNKKENINEVVQLALQRVLKKSNNSELLSQDIARTYYSETQRIKRMPWRIDPPDEKDYWDSIKTESQNIESSETEEEKYEGYTSISESIILRYANEIAGTFDPKAYSFAKRFLSFGFATLLNAFQARNLKALWDHQYFIQESIKIKGDIHKIRELAKTGTVIMLPTHFSNMDSIIMGWSIHAIGLPAFMYGAGLNLYNYRMVGSLMNRLGAYKVDRRKKNPFYLETLKAFSEISIEKGCHSLFFPGGTRSRSGAMEHQLKLGLLGSAFDAQRDNIIKAQENKEKIKKIYVVPAVLSYHVVLEAKSLIRQYIKSTQKEAYYFSRNDEFSSKSKVINFISQLLRKKSEIYLSLGEPMDLFGNEVDANGESVKNDQIIDISDYFKSNGTIQKNSQRDGIYTKELGQIIIEKYLTTDIVLTSYAVARVAFRYFLQKFNTSDLSALYEANPDDLYIPMDEFKVLVADFVATLKDMESNKELKLEEDFDEPIDHIILDGIKNLGVFHNNSPLMINKQNQVVSKDIELLYYYSNRLNGYNFDK